MNCRSFILSQSDELKNFIIVELLIAFDHTHHNLSLAAASAGGSLGQCSSSAFTGKRGYAAGEFVAWIRKGQQCPAQAANDASPSHGEAGDRLAGRATIWPARRPAGRPDEFTAYRPLRPRRCDRLAVARARNRRVEERSPAG